MVVAVSPTSVERPKAKPFGPQQFEPLEIVSDRCKGCGLCVDACPKHILVLGDSGVNELGYHAVRLTDPAACTSCALCARVCPDAVFTVYARSKGA